MPAPLTILCYHRVLPDEERHSAGRPYFVRGTAVSEDNFAAQMRAVAQHFQVVSEADVLAWLDGKYDLVRPSCWITFDDGYRDVLERAAPILARHNLPATVFVATAVIEEEGRWLPADHWYATLTRATRSRGVLQMSGEPPWEFNLTRDYERFIDGSEKRRYLRVSPSEQAVLRGCLADALGTVPPPRPDLYLAPDDLRCLADAGWTIGGHGHTHALLTHVEEANLGTELQVPRRALQALGFSPSALAYPDGACDADVAAATKNAGWSTAVNLENRAATLLDDRFLLPRLLPRDDRAWVEGTLMTVRRTTGG